MSTPTVGVLALQGDVREHMRSLEAVGARAVSVRRLENLEEIDGLIIPGGESTTMSKLAIDDGFLEPLRAARRAGMPMFGSCAGLIMLADRLTDARPDQEVIGGLDVTVRRNAFGRQIDSFEIDLEFAALGSGPFRAVFIRAPRVDAIGDGVDVLARVPDGSAAGSIVAVREGQLMATAFHPELTGDHRIHQMFLDCVKQST